MSSSLPCSPAWNFAYSKYSRACCSFGSLFLSAKGLIASVLQNLRGLARGRHNSRAGLWGEGVRAPNSKALGDLADRIPWLRLATHHSHTLAAARIRVLHLLPLLHNAPISEMINHFLIILGTHTKRPAAAIFDGPLTFKLL